MYKVLVVDDEFRQRMGIVKHVDWKSLNVKQVESAENGLQALEIAKELMPDILITDIKMQGMDGLELIEKMTELVPGLKSIIISGYDEFEYARAAIELKAQVYILKPVNLQKLHDELKKLIALCENERLAKDEYIQLKEYLEQSKPLLIDKFLKDLLYGNYVDNTSIERQIKLLDIDKLNANYYIALFSISESEPGQAANYSENIMIAHKLNMKFKDIPNIMFTQIGDNKFVLFISAISDKAIDIVYNIKEYINNTFGVAVTVGVSEEMKGLLHVHEAYNQATKALREKFFIGEDKVIFYKSRTNEEAIYNIDEIYKELLNCVEIGDCNGGQQCITEIFNIFTKYYVNMLYIKTFCFRLTGDLYKLVYDLDGRIEDIFGNENSVIDKMYRFDTIVDVKMWITNVVIAITEYVGDIKRKNYNSVIEQVKSIINEKYFEDIKIEDLAKEVYLSPNYLCNLFKEEVGVSIIDYLTTVRINFAKKLLKTSDKKMYEIAEMTGFNSASYFSNVFKNITGLSPKEYRELQQN